MSLNSFCTAAVTSSFKVVLLLTLGQNTEESIMSG